MSRLTYYWGALVGCVMVLVTQWILGRTAPWYTPIVWVAVWAIWEGIASLIRRRRRKRALVFRNIINENGEHV